MFFYHHGVYENPHLPLHTPRVASLFSAFYKNKYYCEAPYICTNCIPTYLESDCNIK